MPGERGQAHLDRLPVADVREHGVEHRQHRELGRRTETGLVEQRGEAERLQRDRLAARVRPADHERAHVAQVEVDRDSRCPVEQRVPCTDQAHRLRDLDGCAVPRPREGSARDRQVDRTARLDERDEIGGPEADSRRELAQDPRHLLALGRGRLREPVRELDHLERLDEQRLARVRDVVDDPLHAASRARLDREHRAPAALRDELLLEVLPQPGAPREPLQLLGHAQARLAQLPAQLPEQGGGAVADVGAVLFDRPSDLLAERAEPRLDRRGQAGQERRGLAERGAHAQTAAYRRGDRPQHRRIEDAAARGQLDRCAHVLDPFEGGLG